MNPILKKFLNEVLRPEADRLAGIVRRPADFLAEWAAKGIGPLLGVPDELLTRETPLLPQDYATVDGTPLDDGRAAEGVVQLSAREVLAFYRIYRSLAAQLAADPHVEAVARRIAINPRG